MPNLPPDQQGGVDLPLSELIDDPPPGMGPTIRLIKRALREGRVTPEHSERAIADVRARHAAREMSAKPWRQ